MAKKRKQKKQKQNKVTQIVNPQSKRQQRLAAKKLAADAVFNEEQIEQQRKERKKERDRQRAAYVRLFNKNSDTINKNNLTADIDIAYRNYIAERNTFVKNVLFLEFYDLKVLRDGPIDVIEDAINDIATADVDTTVDPMYVYKVWQMIDAEGYENIARYVVIYGTPPNVTLKIKYANVNFIPKVTDSSEVTLYTIKGKRIRKISRGD